MSSQAKKFRSIEELMEYVKREALKRLKTKRVICSS